VLQRQLVVLEQFVVQLVERPVLALAPLRLLRPQVADQGQRAGDAQSDVVDGLRDVLEEFERFHRDASLRG
jgi:hypothetical protein